MSVSNAIHKEPHPFAGKTITIKEGTFAGQDYRVEDWWDRVGPAPWYTCVGNFACMEFAQRTGAEIKIALFDRALVNDDEHMNEVVYGHIGAYGKLMHIAQLPSPDVEPELNPGSNGVKQDAL